MSELKPRVICDLCRKGDGDNLCYAGGVNKCWKDGQYTKFELHRVPPAEPPVRCGECANYQTQNCAAKHEQALMDFCSHGIRKPGGEQDAR